MTLATVSHFALFAFWPDMTAADISLDGAEFVAIELPPEIKIPEPPAAISRPATPVIATSEISPDITMAVTTFEANPVSDLPPPPEDVTTTDPGEIPHFTPMTVVPGVKNRQEVARAMEREYPALLRDAGIGGTVMVWFYINEEGRVVNTLVKESSRHNALDAAALKVANIIEFTPALNRDKRVPVWISLEITFEAK
jgi:TonB family protein